MIEITKACTVALMRKEIPCLFNLERNVSIGKKSEDDENLFLRILLIDSS